MEGKWDLSCLYSGFDDPKFAADLASLSQDIEALSQLLQADLPAGEKLERILHAQEAFVQKASDIGEMCQLTLAVDAGNLQAQQNFGRFIRLMNAAELVSSRLVSFVGGLDDLESLIASSEKLRAVAFALREMKDQCTHLIDPAVEPWIL